MTNLVFLIKCIKIYDAVDNSDKIRPFADCAQSVDSIFVADRFSNFIPQIAGNSS